MTHAIPSFHPKYCISLLLSATLAFFPKNTYIILHYTEHEARFSRPCYADKHPHFNLLRKKEIYSFSMRTIWKFHFSPPTSLLKWFVFLPFSIYIDQHFNLTGQLQNSLAVVVIWKLLPLHKGQHAKIRLIQKCWHWVFPWFWSKRRGGTGFGQVAINMILVVAPCVCASSNFSFIWIRTLSSQLN